MNKKTAVEYHLVGGSTTVALYGLVKKVEVFDTGLSNVIKRIVIAVLVFFFGVTAVAYWLYRKETQREPDVVSISRFDYIFSKDINLATSLANMPALREVSLGGDDIEVRIWREYSLPTLEGVFLKRVNGKWSGLHIGFESDQNGDRAEVL